MRSDTLALGIVISVTMYAVMAIGSCVGERAPSPSPGVPTATARADSEAAPARPLETGASGGWGWGQEPSEGYGTFSASPRASSESAPASTVTTQALVASPSATAYLVIDPVPATPLTTARPVETLAPKSDISELIAASPWPQSLWGTVACLVERESKGDAGAIGKAGERGLMQVHPITWPYLAQYGITPDQLFDPAENLRAGYLLFIEAGGLRPWGGGCA